ncbi:MAG: Zn-dependent hydrolase [Burkholderiales bacterium]|jgi:N-carbamoyl-L-amino-acid hydrolase|nr:Zn-dependent hydrolase [Burkholderiales bacterium]
MDKPWMMDVLTHLSTIGRTKDNGSHRLAYSNEDDLARDYFIGLMKKAHLNVRVDAVGNIIGRLEGQDPHAGAIATGSHIDTVPNGGHYDGMTGAVAGLAALMRLQKRGALKHPLELIIFQMEESSRFAMATFGSKAMTGKISQDIAKTLTDKDGIPLPLAMERVGLDIEKMETAVRQKGEIDAFIELHIEQSPTLELNNLGVGIVKAIAAPIRTHVKVIGKASHSGGTAMNQRKDALVTASEVVLAVNEVANAYASKDIVGTVGNLVVKPGAINVVPGEVDLWIDLRGINRAAMDAAQAEIEKRVREIEKKYGTPIHLKPLVSDNPVTMSPEIIEVLGQSAQALGIATMQLPSGAGHDAMNMGSLAKVGMIFIRNKDGLSHHPLEYASPDDIALGVDLLTEALYRLAK